MNACMQNIFRDFLGFMNTFMQNKFRGISGYLNHSLNASLKIFFGIFEGFVSKYKKCLEILSGFFRDPENFPSRSPGFRDFGIFD